MPSIEDSGYNAPKGSNYRSPDSPSSISMSRPVCWQALSESSARGLAAEGVGPIAIGQPRLTYVLNAAYGIPKWPALSVDLNLTRLGAAPASLDNALYAHALNDLDLGSRYRFTVLGKPATLRAQIINLTNAKVWSTAYTPGLFQQAPRTLFVYLTADF
jgi:outer membrane receptor protein involved in Fe transport